MAKKKARKAARRPSSNRSSNGRSHAKTAKSRKKKSAEEMISELQDKIREVKQRERLRQLRKSGSITKAISVVRGIDKALEIAAEEGNNTLRHALAGARRPLGNYLSSQGVKLPKVKLPRGRKPAELN